MNKQHLIVLLGWLLLSLSGCNQKEIAELRDQADAATEQIQATSEAHSASIESLQKQLKKLEAKAAELETSLDEAAAAHEQTLAKLDGSASQIKSLSDELAESRTKQQSATAAITTLQKERVAIQSQLAEQHTQTTTRTKELNARLDDQGEANQKAIAELNEQFNKMSGSVKEQLADERSLRDDMTKHYETALADKAKALNLVRLTAKAISESGRVRARAERDLATLAGLEIEILEHLGKLAGSDEDHAEVLAHLPEEPVTKEDATGAKAESVALKPDADAPLVTANTEATKLDVPNKAKPPSEPQQTDDAPPAGTNSKPPTETPPATPAKVKEEPEPEATSDEKPAPSESNDVEPSDSPEKNTSRR